LILTKTNKFFKLFFQKERKHKMKKKSKEVF